ncbi:MAG: sialate O-acetylesterase [Akkermansiaceae bacterium]|nr:sialate O-acetylesterase [Akkermansiaceae bacterium]
MNKFGGAAWIAGVLLVGGLVEAAPLKVYLMAGQSNMQGHCKVTTFPHLAMETAGAAQ